MKCIRLGLFLPLLIALYVYFTAVPNFVSEHFADTYDKSPSQAEPRPTEPPRGVKPEKKHSSSRPTEASRGVKPEKKHSSSRPTELPRGVKPEKKYSSSRPTEPSRGVKLEKKHSSSSIPAKSANFKGGLKLPQYVIDRVKTFVFFLGYAHSGHSIVGSLMDSHPQIVISHELNLFAKLSNGVIAPNKTAIFDAIWKNTVETIINGIRAENAKGYNLTVGNSYEGKYVDHIDVIGDKKGGMTTLMLWRQPSKWAEIFNIIKVLNLTLKVILVYRNPYDIVATTYLYAHHSYEQFASIKKANKTIHSIPSQVDHCINDYFSYFKAIVDAKKKYNLDMIEIHGKDLILHPRDTVLKWCNDLQVTCSDDYLDTCSNKIFKTESRTRRLITWSDGNLKMMKQYIGKYSSLKDYSFDSL